LPLSQPTTNGGQTRKEWGKTTGAGWERGRYEAKGSPKKVRRREGKPKDSSFYDKNHATKNTVQA